MKSLVTGGAGFIGSHIADELVRLGHEVIVFDDLSTGLRDNINPRATFTKGDVRNLSSDRIPEVDYVFHCAAQISVPRSVADPEETYDINVKGTEKLIATAQHAKKIIFSSSTAVYGDNPFLPLDESSELLPLSPYAESKIRAERLLEKSGIPYVALRYFNVYGPRQNPDSPYAAVVPIFVQRALAGEEIMIFGDGKQTRDFIYISDVVKANISAMLKGQGIYNICSGKHISVNELAAIIKEQTNSSSRVTQTNERPGDIRESLGNNLKAQKELMWRPKVGIRGGLKKYIEWLE
jgi:UDP-glucose 4-epimerase